VLDNIEIGLKGTFLDGRLRLNAALFDISTDGYVEQTNVFFYPPGVPPVIIGQLNAYGAANNNPLLQGLNPGSPRVRGGVNIGDMGSTGLELDGSYLLNDNWQIDAQLTYLKTEFDSACSPSGPTFAVTATALPLPGGGSLPCSVVDGNAFPFTPEIQFGASATYNSVLSNGWGWFTRLDMRHEDEQFIDSFETGWLPAVTKFNLRAGINTDNMRIEGYVENLTDDRTPLGAQYEPERPEISQATGIFGPGAVGINVAAGYPREVGIRFSYDF